MKKHIKIRKKEHHDILSPKGRIGSVTTLGKCVEGKHCIFQPHELIQRSKEDNRMSN